MYVFNYNEMDSQDTKVQDLLKSSSLSESQILNNM